MSVQRVTQANVGPAIRPVLVASGLSVFHMAVRVSDYYSNTRELFVGFGASPGGVPYPAVNVVLERDQVFQVPNLYEVERIVVSDEEWRGSNPAVVLLDAVERAYGWVVHDLDEYPEVLIGLEVARNGRKAT